MFKYRGKLFATLPVEAGNKQVRHSPLSPIRSKVQTGYPCFSLYRESVQKGHQVFVLVNISCQIFKKNLA